MNLFICFVAVRVIYFSLVGATMQVIVNPSGSIKTGEEVSITCSTGSSDAESIEVQFAGTRCLRGCTKSGSASKCKPINEACSVSEDKTNLTLRMTASENLNDKIFRCSYGTTKASQVKLAVKATPLIEAVSTKIKLPEGQDTTLFCQIRTIVSADIKWWFKDTLLQTKRIEAASNRFRWNVTYDLRQVAATSAGSYYCTANRVDDTAAEDVTRSTDVEVIVVQPPSSVTLQNVGTTKFDVDNRPVIAANERVTFKCQAVTAPDSECKLSIYKSAEGSGDRVLLNSCESETCEAVYSVDAESGAISISCEAQNEATLFQKRPVKSNDYTFSIIRVPASIEADISIDGSSSLEVQENSNLTIRCKSKGAAIPAVKIVLMQGESVFGSSTYCTYTQTPIGKETNCAWEMAANQITRENNLLYSCNSFHLDDEPARSDHVQIKFKPTHILMFPNNHLITVTEKENIMVECRTSSANPPVEITWTRDGQPYTDVQNSNTEGQYNGRVTVSSMQFEAVRNNDWNITCSVPDTDIQESVLIVVNYPPDLSISVSSDEPKLGDEIRLTCEASNGKPDASTLTDLAFSWEKQDGGNDKNTWSVVESDRVYVIPNATLADNGIYRCLVSAQSGNNAVKQELRLRHAPILGSQQPNRVVLTSASCENNPEDFVCASIALNLMSEPPGIECLWERNGEALNGIGNVLAQANQTHCILVITSPKSDRSVLGRYVLFATNAVGRSSFSVQVQLPSAPHKPTEVSTRSTPISCTVEWTSGFSGGEQQTFYVSAIQAPPAARGIASLNQTTISITVHDTGFGARVSGKLRSLEPDTNYEIGVKAINTNPSDNESDTEWVTCKTTSMPKTAATIEKTGTKEDTVFIRFKGDQRLPSALRTVLRYCNKASLECKNASINGPSPVSLDVQLPFNDLIKQYSFDVLVLDEEDLIVTVPIAIPPTSKEKLKQSGMQTEVLIGIAIGGIFIAVLFIACTIFMLRRKHAPNEAVSRSARRSSSEDDQNQVNKPLMKDNGAIQQGSPRCYSDSARRPPNAGGNFKKTADFPGNKNKDNSSNNNNNNNHSAARNAKTSRSIDCEMAEFDAKQALMKAHEAEREAELAERELKKDFQNAAFDSAEKQRDGHEDIMKAVFDVPNEKPNTNEKDNTDAPDSQEAHTPRNNNKHEGETTPMSDDGANGGERSPGLEKAGEIPEYDTRYTNDAAKPVYVALNKNGVHASIV